MIIYLAGRVTGNLIKEWKKFMKLYLASMGNELVGAAIKKYL